MKTVKKLGIAFLVVVGLAVGGLAAVSSSGLKLLGRGLLGGGGDLALLEELAWAFLQDLQYKDFDAAAQYHTLADQAKVELPKLIERLFQVKPELLNIRDFKITDVTVDTGGKRARTFFTANLELLNTARDGNPNEERKVEGILYWHKRPAAEGKPGAAAPATTEAPPATTDGKAPPTTDGKPPTEAEKWFMELESSLH